MKYEWERSIGGMIATRENRRTLHKKILSQFKYVRHKSHTDCLRIEPESPPWSRLLAPCVMERPTASLTPVQVVLSTSQALPEDEGGNDVFRQWRWN